jgi:transposase
MGRPPVIAPETKTRVVLAVLSGEMSVAEAARKEKVSEQSIHRWKADFVEAGKTALTAGKSGPSTREAQLEAEVADLTQALGEAAVELRVWKKSAAAAGPFADLEVIRRQAGMPTARFAALIGVPERSYRALQV